MVLARQDGKKEIEIGKELNVTESRIAQLLKDAEKRIRLYLESKN